MCLSQIGSLTETLGSAVCGDAFKFGCGVQMHTTTFVDVVLMSTVYTSSCTWVQQVFSANAQYMFELDVSCWCV